MVSMKRPTTSEAALLGVLLTAIVQLFACDTNSDSPSIPPQGGQGGAVGANAKSAGASGLALGAVAGAPAVAPACVSAIATFCAGYADYQARCDVLTPSDREANYSECIGEAAVLPLSCTYAEAVAECLSTNDCATSDDRCVFDGFLATEPPSWNIPVIRDCIAGTVTDDAVCEAALGGDTRTCINRLEECIGGPYEDATNVPYVDDRCFSLVALVPDATRAAMQCLSLPCDDIAACLSAAGTFSY
jgi:hypothetical protein